MANILEDIRGLKLPNHLVLVHQWICLVLGHRVCHVLETTKGKPAPDPPTTSRTVTIPKKRWNEPILRHNLEAALDAAVSAFVQPLPSLGPKQDMILERMKRLFPDAVALFDELENQRSEIAKLLRSQHRELYHELGSSSSSLGRTIRDSMTQYSQALALAISYRRKASKRDLGRKSRNSGMPTSIPSIQPFQLSDPS